MHGFSLILPKLANHLESIAAMESYNHWDTAAISPAAMPDSIVKSPLESSLKSSGLSPPESQSSTRMTTTAGHSLTLEYSPELADEFNFGIPALMITTDNSEWPRKMNGAVVRRMKKVKMASGRVLTITQSYCAHANLNEISRHPSLLLEKKAVTQELRESS
jgi:hypothetical protein